MSADRLGFWSGLLLLVALPLSGPVGMAIAGAVLTARDARWVLTPAGLAAFLAWNVVILAMVLCLVLALRERRPQ